MQQWDSNPHKLVYGAVGSDDWNLGKEGETPSSFAAKDTLRERLEAVLPQLLEPWISAVGSCDTIRKAEERCVSVMSSFLWHKIAPESTKFA